MVIWTYYPEEKAELETLIFQAATRCNSGHEGMSSVAGGHKLVYNSLEMQPWSSELTTASQEEPMIVAEPKSLSTASKEEPMIAAEPKFKFEACACDDVKKRLCALSEQVEQLLHRQDLLQSKLLEEDVAANDGATKQKPNRIGRRLRPKAANLAKSSHEGSVQDQSGALEFD